MKWRKLKVCFAELVFSHGSTPLFSLILLGYSRSENCGWWFLMAYIAIHMILYVNLGLVNDWSEEGILIHTQFMNLGYYS